MTFSGKLTQLQSGGSVIAHASLPRDPRDPNPSHWRHLARFFFSMSRKFNKSKTSRVVKLMEAEVDEDVNSQQQKVIEEPAGDKNPEGENNGLDDVDRSSESEDMGLEGDDLADYEGDSISVDNSLESKIETRVQAGLSKILDESFQELLKSHLETFMSKNVPVTEIKDQPAKPPVPQSPPMASIRSSKGSTTTTPKGSKTEPVRPILKDTAAFVSFGTPESTTLGTPTPKPSIVDTSRSIGNLFHSLYSIMCITFSSRFFFLFLFVIVHLGGYTLY